MLVRNLIAATSEKLKWKIDGRIYDSTLNIPGNVKMKTVAFHGKRDGIMNVVTIGERSDQ